MADDESPFATSHGGEGSRRKAVGLGRAPTRIGAPNWSLEYFPERILARDFSLGEFKQVDSPNLDSLA